MKKYAVRCFNRKAEWIDREGKTHAIRDMDTDHIRNVIAMMQRNAARSREMWLKEGALSPADRRYLSSLSTFEVCCMIDPRFRVFMDEIGRRMVSSRKDGECAFPTNRRIIMEDE